MSETRNACVHCKINEDICELVMDNPGRSNALSYPLLEDLSEKLAIARQEKVRVVILSGAGHKFSAGGDFTEMTGTVADLAMDDAIEKVVHAIRAMSAPVIAAVEGPCMGGAVDIALACDLLVAGDSAVFRVPATRMGLLYNPRAMQRWQRRLSGPTLRTLLLTGEQLSADAAFQAGVVSHVVTTGAVQSKAHELAAGIMQGTPDAVAATKGLLLALETGEAKLDEWETIRRDIIASPERAESVATAKRSKPT